MRVVIKPTQFCKDKIQSQAIINSRYMSFYKNGVIDIPTLYLKVILTKIQHLIGYIYLKDDINKHMITRTKNNNYSLEHNAYSGSITIKSFHIWIQCG